VRADQPWGVQTVFLPSSRSGELQSDFPLLLLSSHRSSLPLSTDPFFGPAEEKGHLTHTTARL